MSISGGDLTNMRAGMTHVRHHLNVAPKVVVGTMLINQSSFLYPLNELTVDTVSLNGGLADITEIPPNCMVYVGTSAGAHDVMITTVAQAATTTTKLIVTGMSSGDPGAALANHALLANNQHVTILANAPLWGQLSRIYDQTFYKKFDVAYSDQLNDPDPVCNIGRWRRLELTGASVSLSLTASATSGVKPGSWAWGARTISSYAWTIRNESYQLNTGASFNGGVDNAATVQVDFDTAGFYIVDCTITDSAGNTHRAETYVWVVDGSTEADLTGWSKENDVQDRKGRRMDVILNGDVAESSVYPGAAFLYTKAVTYNGNTVSDGAVVDTFAGYVMDEERMRDTHYGRVKFSLGSPAHILELIPAASQYLIEVADPSSWIEIDSDLSHPYGVIWYVLHFHAPAALQLFDFWPLDDEDLRGHVWTLNADSIWGQLEEVQPDRLIVGCLSKGSIKVSHDPLLMSAAERAALDTQMTWTSADLRGDEPIAFPVSFNQKIGTLDAYSFAYDGSTVSALWSRAPGDSASQGRSRKTVNGLLVSSSSSQTELNRIAGHLFSKLNNPTPQVVFYAINQMDTADPAMAIFHDLTLSSSLDPRGVGYSSTQFLPSRVTRAIRDGLETIEVVMEMVTSGQAGISKQIPGAGESLWAPSSWFPVTNFGTYEPNDPDAGSGLTEDGVPIKAIAFSWTGAKVARATTADKWTSAPVWEDISTGLSGNCTWATADPWNYRRYFVTTREGVFRCDDVWSGSPVWTQIWDSEDVVGAGFYPTYIAMSINRRGWIGLCLGIRSTYISFDYGETFTKTSGGADQMTTSKYWFPLAVSPYNTVDVGWVYAHIEKEIYKSTDWGLTWTNIAGQVTGGDWIENGSGTIYLPYIRGSGLPNINDGQQELWVQLGDRGIGNDYCKLVRSYAAGVTGTYADSFGAGGAHGDETGVMGPSVRSLNMLTVDGMYMATMSSLINFGTDPKIRGIVYWSTNNGVTWIESGNHPDSAQDYDAVYCNGWPDNSDFLLSWGRHSAPRGYLKMTQDKGASAWTDLTGNLVTGGIFSNMAIAYAEMGQA